MKQVLIISTALLLSGCFETEYELKKYYKDPNSPAARMMGGTYAGVVESFKSQDLCLQRKVQVEQNDRKIGYTNSRFECEPK